MFLSISFSPSVSNPNASSAYFWFNLKGEKPLSLGYVNWEQKEKEFLCLVKLGATKKEQHAFTKEQVLSIARTIQSVQKHSKVSYETTQPL